MASTLLRRKVLVLSIVSTLVAMFGVTQVVAWQQAGDVQNYALDEDQIVAPDSSTPRPKKKKSVER